MKCPACGHPESKVIDSRPSDEGSAIRRRRECLMCLKRFTTYENVELIPLMVVKKDSSREPFDRNKLMRGIMKACEKRPVTAAQIQAIAGEIETSLYNRMENECYSSEIGLLVMEQLKKADEVAYVRFASVYRDFKDVNTFMEELKHIMKNKRQKK